MIDKESIKARSENYAIDVNEYGPIEEAFSDGANWGIKQLQAEAEKENKRIVENGVYKIQQLQAEVDELKSDSKIQVNATREAGMLYLKHTEQLQAEIDRLIKYLEAKTDKTLERKIEISKLQAEVKELKEQLKIAKHGSIAKYEKAKKRTKPIGLNKHF